MPGKLTTHILDTAQGKPAANIAITLWQYTPDVSEKTLVKQVYSNSDGRTDAPLLAEGELQMGTYELVFSIGDYFKQQQAALPDPCFLDQVPIRFSIADPNAHYHVPLLASPWSYSTYRGS